MKLLFIIEAVISVLWIKRVLFSNLKIKRKDILSSD